MFKHLKAMEWIRDAGVIAILGLIYVIVDYYLKED